MRISLLGPLRVELDGSEVTFAAAKERSLVSVLALTPGSVVSSDVLVDALWGDNPPVTAKKTLQTYVSNVRRVLGPDAIATTPPGYALRVAAGDVDVARFRTLVRDGEQALRNGSSELARRLLGEAVALWRGDPFAEVAPQSGLAAESVRLKEEYLSALEARLAADLADGGHAELVGELEALTRAHPYRERIWGHLMVALYRCGRQADALATFRRARQVLSDELGLEPGGELRRIEAAVLAHDASLESAGQERRPAGRPAPQPPPVRSPVRYATTCDGVHIAYQVVGDGPVDVLAIPGFISHLDLWWDAPTDALVRRLASFSRLILFDKRGMGLSDRPGRVCADDWVEDALSVLDAVGSQQTVVFGISAGAPTAVLLASRHPQRTRALALYGGYGRYLDGPGYEVGVAPEAAEQFVGHMEAGWGTGVGISVFAPSRAKDPDAVEYWARTQRISASPSAASEFLRALTQIDVREALGSVVAPTLVLHPARDVAVPVAAARLMAARIPGARLVELDTDIHLIWLSDVIDDVTAELQSFVAQFAPAPPQRVLATVLAVSPVPGSTRRARQLASVVEQSDGRMSGAAGRATFDSPASAIRCATTLGEVGVGVHTGECELTADGVAGVAVDVAARLAALAAPGEVLVSQTVRDLTVGSGIDLVPRGHEAFPGVPVAWEVFAVGGGRTAQHGP